MLKSYRYRWQFAKGSTWLRYGQWRAAARSFRRAIALDPRSSWAHNHLGIALLKLGRWEEAIGACQCAITLDADLAESHENLAVAFLKLDRWDEAIAACRRTVKRHPGSRVSHERLGMAFSRLGRWGDAVTAYQDAVNLDSSIVESHEHLILALLKQERWDDAGAACRRAIALHPGSQPLYERLGIALLKQERWAEAADAYRKTIELGGTHADLHRNLGAMLVQAGKPVEAAAAYRRAIELEPKRAELYRYLGLILIGLEQWGEAVGVCRQALTLEPGNSESLVLLTTALAQFKGSDETVAAQQLAMAREPVNPEAMILLGIELSKLERWKEAVAALREGAKAATNDACYQFLLVDPLMRLGQVEEASNAYRRALEVGGNLPSLPGESAGARFDRRRAAFWTRTNLSDEVFEVERWLEELASVPVSPGSDPNSNGTGSEGSRLLFVLDNDYGELTTLMYLLLGRPLINQTQLLLPDRLFASNAEALPGRTFRYSSLDDIIRFVDQEKPDIVFLCSGYLFSIHRLLSFDDLEDLVRALRHRGCRLVTSDPFLGMLSKRDPRTLVSIDIPDEPTIAKGFADDPELHRRFLGQIRKTKEVEDRRLRTHFTRSEKIFRDAYHLYPAHCHVPATEATSTDARNTAFFNSNLIRPNDRSSNHETRPPHWLFILSQTDYDTQVMFEGPLRFADIVARKLMDTLAAGRHPIMLAPNDLIGPLTNRIPTTEGIDLLSYCPFNRMISLLLTAEYAFYWNILSHSILIRLFNRLPTVVFDRGHLVRNVPALYDRVVQWYYQGFEPALADHRQPLTLDSVAEVTKAYRREADAISQRFGRALSPEQMIEQLRRGPASFID